MSFLGKAEGRRDGAFGECLGLCASGFLQRGGKDIRHDRVDYIV